MRASGLTFDKEQNTYRTSAILRFTLRWFSRAVGWGLGGNKSVTMAAGVAADAGAVAGGCGARDGMRAMAGPARLAGAS